MVTRLQTQTPVSPCLILCCSSSSNSKIKGKKNQDQTQQKQILKSKNKSTTLSFPKPKPTPLLIHHKPYPQTKYQALDSVVSELESSIEKGVAVDIETFSSLLETCYRLQAIEHGLRIHRLIPPNLLRRNLGLGSKLVRLYASLGYVEEAHELFDQMSNRNISAFPWNSLISGYTEVGLHEDAMALYFQMLEEGVDPDLFTFPRVLKACAGIGLIQVGEEVHRHVIRSGFSSDGFVLNALLDMYAKCGHIVKARRIFDMIPCRDSVSWNSMITAYMHHGLLVDATNIFCQMIEKGYEPDSVAISTVLTRVSSLDIGVQIHCWAIRRGVEWNLSIVNSLIVMYSNQGKLDLARRLFYRMPERDVVSWNSIISANSKDREALVYFDQMEEIGALPDSITFVSVLSACSYMGLVKDGERIFSIMNEKYGINPRMEHYACLVNLYGRAGLINKAYKIIAEEMKMEAGPTVWGALLYACSLHRNVNIGKIAAEKLFDLEPDNEHNFKLLMKIYDSEGRLEDAERVRMMLVERGLDY